MLVRDSSCLQRTDIYISTNRILANYNRQRQDDKVGFETHIIGFETTQFYKEVSKHTYHVSKHPAFIAGYAPRDRIEWETSF